MGGLRLFHALTFKRIAMLFVNDEPYKMTPTDHKNVIEEFKKLPVRVIYPEERVRKSRSAHNTLPDKPNSLSFPLVAIAKSKQGSKVWRYAENVITTSEGRKKYLPVNFFYTGAVLLTENDMELIWFLWTKCPYTKDGKNWNGKVPKAQFENLVTKADLQAIKEKEMAEFKALLYSDRLGLSESTLRDAGRAMFIGGIDDLTFNQVRVAINNRVSVDRRNGVTKFLKMVNSEAALMVRAGIQKAIDKGLIKYNMHKREWVWLGPGGKKVDVICRVAANMNPHDVIHEQYMGDAGFKEDLDGALSKKKVAAPA